MASRNAARMRYGVTPKLEKDGVWFTLDILNSDDTRPAFLLIRTADSNPRYAAVQAQVFAEDREAREKEGNKKPLTTEEATALGRKVFVRGAILGWRNMPAYMLSEQDEDCMDETPLIFLPETAEKLLILWPEILEDVMKFSINRLNFVEKVTDNEVKN